MLAGEQLRSLGQRVARIDLARRDDQADRQPQPLRDRLHSHATPAFVPGAGPSAVRPPARAAVAPALAAALKADRPEVVELGEELYAEEHYWSPGTVQFARRVRAVDALNGDLLLGHILGAHIGDLAFESSIGFSADERRLGFTPSQNANAPPVQEVLAAIDAAAEELDDDPHAAVAIEAANIMIDSIISLAKEASPHQAQVHLGRGARAGFSFFVPVPSVCFSYTLSCNGHFSDARLKQHLGVLGSFLK